MAVRLFVCNTKEGDLHFNHLGIFVNRNREDVWNQLFDLSYSIWFWFDL